MTMDVIKCDILVGPRTLRHWFAVLRYVAGHIAEIVVGYYGLRTLP